MRDCRDPDEWPPWIEGFCLYEPGEPIVEVLAREYGFEEHVAKRRAAERSWDAFCYPHLCEDFPGEELETLMWLGFYCAPPVD